MTSRVRARIHRTVVAAIAGAAMVVLPEVALASCAWTVVPSPNVNTNASSLYAISAISASDIWAAGAYRSNDNGLHTLIEHWNGQVWNVVPSPNASTKYNFLGAVSARSASDVWAAGFYHGNDNIRHTLTEHWNGTVWSVVPSPNANNNANNLLNAISAISASDVWTAANYFDTTSISRTLTEHWNGLVWNVVPSPNANAKANSLNAISAISPSDVWAAGDYTGADNLRHTLTEHWNSHVWTIVSSPNANGTDNFLSALAAISPSDVWAAGEFRANDKNLHPLTEHWNGLVWTVVPSPSASNHLHFLSAISARASSDVWIAGEYRGNDNATHTLTEHWNGLVWAIVPSPNASSNSNSLNAIAAISASNVWAAGDYFNNANIDRTLIEHWKC